MARFSMKDMLRGMTLVAVGLGMITIVLSSSSGSAPHEHKLWQMVLVTFGGILVGYGLAFPFKWPPHQMMLAMIGMFAAQACLYTGGRVGLLTYLCLAALLTVAQYLGRRWIERSGKELRSD
jgi:hypothetical protein